MDYKQASKLLAITLIPTILYLLRPNLIGVDGYHYLMELENLGGNIVIAKLMLFGSLLLTVFAIGFLGELFNREHGWKAGLLVFLSPSIVFEFAKFETESFAFPLLVLATFFLLKAKKEKRLRLEVVSLMLVIAASFLWQGAAYYLIAFATVSILFLIVSLPTLLLFWDTLIYHATPYLPIVWENRPVVALKNIWILSLGVIGTSRAFVTVLGFFLALALLNGKFVFHPLPLLAVGFSQLIEHKKMKRFASFFVILSFIIAASSGIALHFQPPNQSQLDAIDYSMSVTEPDYEMQNDWELGYWIRWQGGYTQDAAGGPQFIDFEKKGVVLTKQSISCPILKRFDYLTVYDCEV